VEVTNWLRTSSQSIFSEDPGPDFLLQSSIDSLQDVFLPEIVVVVEGRRANTKAKMIIARRLKRIKILFCIYPDLQSFDEPILSNVTANLKFVPKLPG